MESKRGLFSYAYQSSDDQFHEFVKNSKTWTELLKKCGYNNTGNTKTVKKRAKELNISLEHLPKGYYINPNPSHKKSNEEIFVQNSTYESRKNIKKRLVKDFGFELKCSGCNRITYSCRQTEWKEVPIPLELEHKNGINNDNRVENLEFLCPLCHSLTSTYRGKNHNYRNEYEIAIINGEEKKKKKRTKKCIDCDKLIINSSTRCPTCSAKKANPEKDRPSPEILKEEAETHTFTELGKKYNVSDNTIRKWLKKDGNFQSRRKASSKKEDFDIPALKEELKTTTINGLSKKYKVDHKVMKKWLSEDQN